MSYKPYAVLCGRKGELFMPCTEAYKEHIEYTFNAFCRVVIHYAAINAWRDRDKRRISHRRKVLSILYVRHIFHRPLQAIPCYDMRSEGYPHKWKSCRSPVLSAREKEGNHLPLFFRALHTAGNRGTVRTLPEYGVASHTQCLANAA